VLDRRLRFDRPITNDSFLRLVGIILILLDNQSLDLIVLDLSFFIIVVIQSPDKFLVDGPSGQIGMKLLDSLIVYKPYKIQLSSTSLYSSLQSCRNASSILPIHRESFDP
jgi:hypothetical protein